MGECCKYLSIILSRKKDFHYSLYIQRDILRHDLIIYLLNIIKIMHRSFKHSRQICEMNSRNDHNTI